MLACTKQSNGSKIGSVIPDVLSQKPSTLISPVWDHNRRKHTEWSHELRVLIPNGTASKPFDSIKCFGNYQQKKRIAKLTIHICGCYQIDFYYLKRFLKFTYTAREVIVAAIHVTLAQCIIWFYDPVEIILTGKTLSCIEI